MTFTVKAALAAAALLVAIPALANDQLARSLGQQPLGLHRSLVRRPQTSRPSPPSFLALR